MGRSIMTLRLIISGTNSRIPADAFQRLASEGMAGPSRSISKGAPVLEGSTSTPIQRGGGGLSNTTAADLGFWFLCALIFAGTPLYMVLM